MNIKLSLKIVTYLMEIMTLMPVKATPMIG